MTEPSDIPSVQSSPPRTKRRWLRRTFWSLLTIVVVLAALVLLGPTLISTGPGTRLVLALVNHQIAGTVAVDDLSAGWFSGQQIVGLTLDDPQGQQVARIDQIDAPDVTLLSLLRGNSNFGKVRIVSRELHLVQYDDGTTNLDRALSATAVATQPPGRPAARRRQSQPEPLLPPDLRLELELTGSRVVYAAPQTDAVELKDLSATLRVLGPADLAGSLKAHVQQAGASGRIDATFRAKDAFDAQGRPQFARATFNADAQLQDIPIVALDRLLDQDDRLLLLLGPVLNGRLKIEGYDATLVAHSEHLEAYAVLSVSERVLTVHPDSRLRLHVMPGAWAKWFAPPDGQTAATLVDPVDITIKFARGSVRLTEKGADWANASLKADARVGDIALDAGDRIGRIAVRQTVLSVDTQRLGEAVSIRFATTAEHGERSGQVDLDAAFHNMLDAEGKFNLQTASATITGNVTDLPLAVVDELVQRGGVITAALGPRLNAQIVASLRPATEGARLAGSFDLTANAQNLDANLSGHMTSQVISFEPGSTARLTLQPAAFSLLAGLYGRGPVAEKITIAAPAHAELTIDALDIAIVESDDGVRFDIEQLGARLTFDRLVLTGDPRLAGTSLSNVTIRLPKANLKDSLDLSLEADLLSQGRTGSLQGNLKMTDAFTAARRLDAKLRIQSLPVALLDMFAGRPGLLPAVLDPSLDQVDLDVTIAGDSNEVSFASRVVSPRLNADVAGRFIPDKQLTLRDGSSVELTLTPQAIEALQQWSRPSGARGSGSPPPVEITGPVQVKMVVAECDVAFSPDGYDPAGTKLVANLTSSGTSLLHRGSGQTIQVENVSVALDAVNLNKLVSVLATADFSLTDPQTGQVTHGKLDSQTRLVGIVGADGALDLSRAVIDTKTDVTSLPTALIDALTQDEEGFYTALFGPTFARIHLEAHADQDRKVTFTGAIASAQFNADVTGEYVPGRHVAFRSDAPVKMVLSPRAFAAIQRRLRGPQPDPNVPVALDQPAEIELAFNRVQIGLAEAEAQQDSAPGDAGAWWFDPSRTHVTGLQLSVPALALRHKQSDQRYEFQGLTASLDAPDLRRSVTLHAEGHVGVTDPLAEAPSFGKLRSDTTITHLVTDDGRLDVAAALFDTNTELRDIPVEPIDALIGGDGSLPAALGRSATLTLIGKFSQNQPGDLDLVLTSENAQVRILATIGRELTLREDAVVTMRLTPQLAKTLLKLGNPILIDATEAAEPIKLTIKRDGFGVPLQAYDLARVTGNFELELGQVTLEDSWLMNALIPELRQLGAALPHNRRQVGQFTTLKVHVEKGVVTSNDLWFQSPDMLVGTQGKINLKTNRANMVVGISGRMFRTIPGLADAVAPNAVYELPVNGDIDNLNTDKLAFAGELALGGVAQQLLGVDLRGLFKKQKWQWPNQPKVEEAQEKTSETSQSSDESSQQKPEREPDKDRQDDPLRDLLNDLLR